MVVKRLAHIQTVINAESEGLLSQMEALTVWWSFCHSQWRVLVVDRQTAGGGNAFPGSWSPGGAA